jgi:hypothetical protein
MAVVDEQLYFAPGILMKDLDFNDPAFVLKAFQYRVHGLFIEPIVALEQREDIQEGALFGAALLVAALIESIARVEHTVDANGSLIKTWLEAHVDEFSAECPISGGREAGAQPRSLADVFEYRFRNGLAHNGYVASLGRLSSALKRPVTASGSVVTVNPFLLARVVGKRFESFAADLLEGRRDIRAFAYRVEKLFREEVAQARAEAAA